MNNVIQLSTIVIDPDRQRQEFDPDALMELTNSIDKIGLLHPPVLRYGVTGKWKLVAGERRLRAIQSLWEIGGTLRHGGLEFKEGYIPFTDIGELDDLSAEEAELEENIKRRDLTWQEHAAAVAKLHQLRTQQAAKEKLDSIQETGNADVPKHTVADTALEVYGRKDGDYHDIARKEILVAKHLSNPAVAKAKSADEAFKILKRQEEAEQHRALGEKVGLTFSAKLHQVFNANCLDWMLTEPPETYDVILTDPPYGMGADNFGDGGGKLAGIEHHYDDSLESWRILMANFAGLSYRVTKPQAHAYVFCDIDNFPQLRALMRAVGWYVFRTPLIVYKTNSGRVPLPDRGPRRQYETILYAIKGNKPVTHIYSDVIVSQADENMSHGAQKPVAVYQNLLLRSVRPGDKVLDTFGGTGTLIPAAHSAQCSATVIEQNQEYYGMCLKRLAELTAQDELGFNIQSTATTTSISPLE